MQFDHITDIRYAVYQAIFQAKTFSIEPRPCSSPAFMYNGEFHEIQDGVGNMVRELLKMIK